MGDGIVHLHMPEPGELFSRYFKPDFSIETPRVLLEPTSRNAPSEIHFSIFDKHTKVRCGNAGYTDISFENASLAVNWQWDKPDEADQGLIKNLKFAFLSFAFDVMKME